jgi:hypothetical protein
MIERRARFSSLIIPSDGSRGCAEWDEDFLRLLAKR